tara:strand:- start:673 stop:816 length:144 start_codon:yes stop_codon:yes gene_type:complete
MFVATVVYRKNISFSFYRGENGKNEKLGYQLIGSRESSPKVLQQQEL